MKKLALTAVFSVLLLAASAQEVMAEYKEVNYDVGQYFGHMQDGKRNGFGIYKIKTGAVYMGMFKEGNYCGFGIYLFEENQPDGFLFQGGFYENNRLNDQGSSMYINSSGSKITRHGFYADGQPVEGDFERTDDVYDWADLEYPGGISYMGQVSIGTKIPNGYGIFTRADGLIHAGMFTDGAADGLGIQMNPDKSYFLGVWETGELTEITEWADLAVEDAIAAVWPTDLDVIPKLAKATQKAEATVLLGILAKESTAQKDTLTEVTDTSKPEALSYYVKYEIRNGENADWETVTIEQTDGAVFTSSGAFYAAFGENNFNNDYVKLVFPSEMKKGMSYDSNKLPNTNGKYWPAEITFRSKFFSEIHEIKTSQSINSGISISPQGAEFNITITGKTDADNIIAFEGIFAGNVGDFIIRNGEFRASVTTPAQ